MNDQPHTSQKQQHKHKKIQKTCSSRQVKILQPQPRYKAPTPGAEGEGAFALRPLNHTTGTLHPCTCGGFKRCGFGMELVTRACRYRGEAFCYDDFGHCFLRKVPKSGSANDHRLSSLSGSGGMDCVYSTSISITQWSLGLQDSGHGFTPKMLNH